MKKLLRHPALDGVEAILCYGCPLYCPSSHYDTPIWGPLTPLFCTILLLRWTCFCAMYMLSCLSYKISEIVDTYHTPCSLSNLLTGLLLIHSDLDILMDSISRSLTRAYRCAWTQYIYYLFNHLTSILYRRFGGFYFYPTFIIIRGWRSCDHMAGDCCEQMSKQDGSSLTTKVVTDGCHMHLSKVLTRT